MQTNGRMVITVVGAALLAACSDSPVGPAAMTPLAKPTFITVDQIPAGGAPAPATVKVCKVWDGTAGPEVTVNVALAEDNGETGNTTITQAQVLLSNGECQTVATTTQSATGVFDYVRVTEVLDAAVFNLIDDQRFDDGGATPSYVNGETIGINTAHGSTIVFTNRLIPTPPPPPPPPAQVCDFSTFGGFVLAPNNISYGGNAGFAKEAFAYGSLNFVNHTTGDHIHVWNVTGYGRPATGPLSEFADARYASGTGTINGAGSFPVEFRFLDNGEPGKNDRVYLKVNGVELIPLQVVQGGNIQLHKNCKKAPKAEKH